MHQFRFAPILRKYQKPYDLVRSADGDYNEDGVWAPGKPNRKRLSGVVQPIKDSLRQSEGGNYSETDRMLYTVHAHTKTEIIEYKGVQYTISEPDERDYSDVNQYVLRQVVANARI